MKRYGNRSENSGAEAYRITDTAIFVKFRNRDEP